MSQHASCEPHGCMACACQGLSGWYIDMVDSASASCHERARAGSRDAGAQDGMPPACPGLSGIWPLMPANGKLLLSAWWVHAVDARHEHAAVRSVVTLLTRDLQCSKAGPAEVRPRRAARTRGGAAAGLSRGAPRRRCSGLLRPECRQPVALRRGHRLEPLQLQEPVAVESHLRDSSLLSPHDNAGNAL